VRGGSTEFLESARGYRWDGGERTPLCEKISRGSSGLAVADSGPLGYDKSGTIESSKLQVWVFGLLVLGVVATLLYVLVKERESPPVVVRIRLRVAP